VPNEYLAQSLLVLTMVSTVVLGVVVFRKNSRALLNRLFLAFALNCSLWALSVLMITLVQDPDQMLLWIRITHANAALTPFFSVAIVASFEDSKKINRKWVLLFFLISIFIAGITMTPAVIQDVGVPLEAREKISGPLFPLYLAIFGGVSLFSFYLMWRKMRTSTGLVRYQMRYLFGGILLSFILGGTVNLLLPLLGIATTNLRNMGPVFTNFAVISITYAIVKYRLMNIHMALRKLAVFSLTIMFLGGVLSLPLLYLVSRPYFPNAPTLLLLVFLAMITGVFFHPLREWIREALVDRYIFRGTSTYYQAIWEISRAIVSILNLEKLLDYLVTRVVDAAEIRQGIFYLRKEAEGPFESMASRALKATGQDSPRYPERLEKENPLLVFLKTHDDVLLRSDLRHNLSTQEEAIAVFMDDLAIEAAVPVNIEGLLSGVFILGGKNSGEPYSAEDVNMLLGLAAQLAVALKNAHYHREVTGMKNYLENILENMRNGLLTVNAAGQIVTFNGAAEAITGLTSAEVMGRRAEDVLSPDLAFFLKQTLLQDRGLGEVELTIPAKDGSWRSLNCSTALVDLPNNERGAILVMSDITWQKELEKEKNRAERLASLGELAAGMAHEIKNPLVSIKTFAELLPERFEEQDFRYNFSRVVGHEIERINNLVTKLLGFARDSDQYLEDVDMADLLEEILLLLSPQLETYRIQLEKYLDPALPPVWADRNQLKQALYNICQNAVEAMTGGGKLSVEALWLAAGDSGQQGGRRKKQGASRQTGTAGEGVSPERGRLQLFIQDTGEGISHQEQEKIFNPFFTTKSYGVGIGLSISHRVISDYGGEIKLHSVEGKGTLFEIYFPPSGSREFVPAASPTKAREHHQSGGKRV